jgi:hypothetical protein
MIRRVACGAAPRTAAATLVAIAAVSLYPARAQAQAWAYPSFQPPRVTAREFNFAVADAGRAGTSLIFQWREGLTSRTQLGLDVGFADPDGEGNGKLLLGGTIAGALTEASAELPLDFLLTGGVNFAVGDGSDLVRIPFGVSIGHRFPLEEGFAITPYVHPRISLDFCTDCSGPDGDDSETDLGIDFDLGANFEVTRNLAFRLSVMFGGSDSLGDHDGFGISLAWTPSALNRALRGR